MLNNNKLAPLSRQPQAGAVGQESSWNY